jgi:hypothetical protein
MSQCFKEKIPAEDPDECQVPRLQQLIKTTPALLRVIDPVNPTPQLSPLLLSQPTKKYLTPNGQKNQKQAGIHIEKGKHFDALLSSPSLSSGTFPIQPTRRQALKKLDWLSPHADMQKTR